MRLEEKLTVLRKKKGLTQADLAEAVCVSRQAVSQWESGRTFPSMEKQLALSRLYGVSPEALYWEDTAREAEEGPEAVPEDAPPLTEDAAEMGGLQADLSHKHKRRKRIVVIALVICVCCGTLLWGYLTNSRAHARNYLIVGAVVSAGGSFAYFLYSLLKKIKEEKK